MISTNTLSMFIFHPHQYLIFNNNLRSIQEIMRTSELANKKYKKVHNDSPNLAILTKRAMSDEVQLTFAHVSFRNKSLGESVAAFALTGSLDSSSVVFIDVNITFAMDDEKTFLPIAEVLLRSDDGNLTRSKKQGYWKTRNAVFLPPFFYGGGNLRRGDLCRRSPQDIRVIHHEYNGGGRRQRWGRGKQYQRGRRIG